jgi:NADH:ubiquinone oxidoreductase subunit 6 (subunit J)
VPAVIYFVAGLGAIAGALGVVLLRNPFYSVLALVFHLLCLAALFLLLNAQFVAAAQVVVYAGAVMVLYVFVVAYIGGAEEPLGRPRSGLLVAGPVFAVALLVELLIALLGSGLSGIGHKGPPLVAAFGTPAEIGRFFLTKFLLAFEVASYLLLIAAVGAVVLARRRRGLEDEPSASMLGGRGEGITATAAARHPLTGTMREEVAVGRRPAARGGW